MVVMYGDFVDLETGDTRIVRDYSGTGGAFVGANGGRNTHSGRCPVVYAGKNCDQLHESDPLAGYTCKALRKEELNCDGCRCASDVCPVVRRVCVPPEGYKGTSARAAGTPCTCMLRGLRSLTTLLLSISSSLATSSFFLLLFLLLLLLLLLLLRGPGRVRQLPLPAPRAARPV